MAMAGDANSHVSDDPGDALVAPVTEVDDRGDQHGLEVPGHRAAFLLGQDGAALGARTLLAEILVLHQGIAFLAPRHGRYFPPMRTRNFIGVAPNSNFSRSPRSMYRMQVWGSRPL